MNILKFEKKPTLNSYLTISLLGKIYKLNIKYTPSDSIKLNKKNSEFILILPKKYKSLDNAEIINQSINKLYSDVAPKEIEDSLELARYILKFAPEDYKIERLNNSFLKIVKKNLLIVNPDIVQYSKEIINTTLIQEFCRMKYGKKTKAYSIAIKKALEEYENYKNNYSKILKYKTV